MSNLSKMSTLSKMSKPHKSAEELQNAASELHKEVPPDWYKRSIKENVFQRFWHKRRFSEVAKLVERIKGGSVLDIGSADGTFSKVILDRSGADKLIGIENLPKKKE